MDVEVGNMYLKITNLEENHHGLQYVDGLNVDPVPFAREGSCCAGGDIFYNPGIYLLFLGYGYLYTGSNDSFGC
jgi:hypothetical protein